MCPPNPPELLKGIKIESEEQKGLVAKTEKKNKKRNKPTSQREKRNKDKFVENGRNNCHCWSWGKKSTTLHGKQLLKENYKNNK